MIREVTIKFGPRQPPLGFVQAARDVFYEAFDVPWELSRVDIEPEQQDGWYRGEISARAKGERA